MDWLIDIHDVRTGRSELVDDGGLLHEEQEKDQESRKYDLDNEAIAADETLAVGVVGGCSVMAFDPSSQDFLWRWKPGKGRMATHLLLTEEKVWVLTAKLWKWRKNGPNEAKLYALDRKTGNGKEVDFGETLSGEWLERPQYGQGAWLDYSPHYDAVLVNLGDHVLRAVSASTQRFEWELNLGFFLEMHLLKDSDADYLVTRLGDDVTMWSLEPLPEPRRVTVSGTVLHDDEPARGVPIAVAGRLTKTDKKGRYSVTFETRGDSLYVFGGGSRCTDEGLDDEKFPWGGRILGEGLELEEGKDSYVLDIAQKGISRCRFSD